MITNGIEAQRQWGRALEAGIGQSQAEWTQLGEGRGHKGNCQHQATEGMAQG
jgi:hypothetical protein